MKTPIFQICQCMGDGQGMVNAVKPVLKQANEVKQTNNQTGDMQPSQAARLIPSEPTVMVTSPVGSDSDSDFRM